MVRDGLVVKSSTTDDKREKMITISTKGLELVELATVKRRLVSNKIMSVLTEEQITDLVKILRLLRKNIRKNLLKE
jgi:DNA-binding MarR family transcriptional regulator